MPGVFVLKIEKNCLSQSSQGSQSLEYIYVLFEFQC